MAEIRRTPTEKGTAIISTLKELVLDSAKSFGSIIKNPEGVLLTGEDNLPKKWNWFVKFDHELGDLFPGSYISPNDFLTEVGVKENTQANVRAMLGKRTGWLNEPTLFVDGDQFSLTVMNGMTSNYAMQMTYLAAKATMTPDKSAFVQDGFHKEPTIRAQYQQAMHDNIKNALIPSSRKPAYRIHDDCLASGDSIMSYLFSKMENLEELEKMRRDGVEVVIDGPATAQGILFLKAFAQQNKFHIDFKVGHMAFGLSEGKKVGNIREHANYITYPEEAIELLDEGFEKELIKGSIYPDGNRYVVQDMGAAEEGLSEEEMKFVRIMTQDDRYASFNGRRGDGHGAHPNAGTLKIPDHVEGLPMAAYLARGGYLPYQFDLDQRAIDGYNVDIPRVSRLWTQEYGYGAAFNLKDE